MMQQSVAPKNNAAAPPPAMGSKRPKLGVNILQEIHEQSLQSTENTHEPLPLSQEFADQLFNEFKEHIRVELRQIPLASQLDMMSIRYISQNELQIVCVTEVNQIYANNQREIFMDFGKKRTFIPDLRIMVQMDASAQKEVKVERKLGNMEIFNIMAGQNPALRMLKDSLNLQVE